METTARISPLKGTTFRRAIPHTGMIEGQEASPIPVLCLPRHYTSDLCQVLQPFPPLPLRNEAWKSRRTLPYIEQGSQRTLQRYQLRNICHTQAHPQTAHCPLPSTPSPDATDVNFGSLSRCSRSKRKIIKTRAGGAGPPRQPSPQPGPPGRLQAPLLPGSPH